MYEYQSVGQVTIFGDFNTRIGDNLDFIPGVDFIPERDIKDFQINQYCDTFINFLISTNLCILNGRNCKNNDFTSISHKGSSVVSYCLVPYEKLDTYCDFKVIRSRDLIERCLNIQSLENIVIPDHSILTWKLCINTYIEKQQDKQGTPQSYVKYDCSNIPAITNLSKAWNLLFTSWNPTNRNNSVWIIYTIVFALVLNHRWTLIYITNG